MSAITSGADVVNLLGTTISSSQAKVGKWSCKKGEGRLAAWNLKGGSDDIVAAKIFTKMFEPRGQEFDPTALRWFSVGQLSELAEKFEKNRNGLLPDQKQKIGDLVEKALLIAHVKGHTTEKKTAIANLLLKLFPGEEVGKHLKSTVEGQERKWSSGVPPSPPPTEPSPNLPTSVIPHVPPPPDVPPPLPVGGSVVLRPPASPLLFTKEQQGYAVRIALANKKKEIERIVADVHKTNNQVLIATVEQMVRNKLRIKAPPSDVPAVPPSPPPTEPPPNVLTSVIPHVPPPSDVPPPPLVDKMVRDKLGIAAPPSESPPFLTTELRYAARIALANKEELEKIVAEVRKTNDQKLIATVDKMVWDKLGIAAPPSESPPFLTTELRYAARIALANKEELEKIVAEVRKTNDQKLIATVDKMVWDKLGIAAPPSDVPPPPFLTKELRYEAHIALANKEELEKIVAEVRQTNDQKLIATVDKMVQKKLGIAAPLSDVPTPIGLSPPLPLPSLKNILLAEFKQRFGGEINTKMRAKYIEEESKRVKDWNKLATEYFDAKPKFEAASKKPKGKQGDLKTLQEAMQKPLRILYPMQATKAVAPMASRVLCPVEGAWNNCDTVSKELQLLLAEIVHDQTKCTLEEAKAAVTENKLPPEQFVNEMLNTIQDIRATLSDNERGQIGNRIAVPPPPLPMEGPVERTQEKPSMAGTTNVQEGRLLPKMAKEVFASVAAFTSEGRAKLLSDARSKIEELKAQRQKEMEKEIKTAGEVFGVVAKNKAKMEVKEKYKGATSYQAFYSNNKEEREAVVVLAMIEVLPRPPAIGDEEWKLAVTRETKTKGGRDLFDELLEKHDPSWLFLNKAEFESEPEK